MLFLGIETSCDETAAAVVRDDGTMLSNVIASSAPLHAVTGGVVPEVAAREHVAAIIPTIDRALREANISHIQLTGIAVTRGPGLVTSLLSGITTANALARIWQLPLIGVHHIAGHIRANWLERNSKDFGYPIIILTASGGHNELVLLESEHSQPTLLGSTRDDAAGEAFDKVARLLGLPYPGGPAIEKAAAEGDSAKFTLPRAWLIPRDVASNFVTTDVGERLRDGRLKLPTFDFSFSGLKSEVRRIVEGSGVRGQGSGFRNDIARGFQDSVVDVLATKLVLAARQFHAREIHLAGGVSANRALRAKVAEYSHTLTPDVRLRWPERMAYCTDNAAMIAAEGLRVFAQNPDVSAWHEPVDAQPRLQF